MSTYYLKHRHLRPIQSLLTPTALILATSLMVLQPVQAQTPEAPSAGTGASPTGISKLEPTSPSTTSAVSVLSIPLPPYTRLGLDIDARDKELLGVVKSFLSGFRGQSLQAMLPSGGFPAPQSPQTPSGTSPGVAQDLQVAAALQLLSQADLEKVLKDITHLRVVEFEVPPGVWVKPIGKAGAMQTPTKSMLGFYEQKYIDQEGGRRMIRADFGDTQWLAVSFPQGGFALVFQASSSGFVLRADGYPDLSSVGSLAGAATVFFAPRPFYPR